VESDSWISSPYTPVVGTWAKIGAVCSSPDVIFKLRAASDWVFVTALPLIQPV